MEVDNYFNLIGRRKQTIFLVCFVVVLFVMIVTLLQPLKYRASTKLLIIQNNTKMDAYNISRSNQMLTSLFSSIVHTDSFFDHVLRSGFNINKDYFSNDPSQRKKQWEGIVNARTGDTGILTIYTYHEDKVQAGQISKAVSLTLQNNHQEYHGLEDKLIVKMVDRTTTSKYPVKPNIPMNFVAAIIAGLIVGAWYVYLFPDRELRFWTSRKKEKSINDNDTPQGGDRNDYGGDNAGDRGGSVYEAQNQNKFEHNQGYNNNVMERSGYDGNMNNLFN